MLRFTDPKQLGYKKCPNVDIWISQERGTTADVLVQLGAVGHGNLRGQVGGGQRGRVLRKMTENGGFKLYSKSLMKGKPP